MPVGDRVAVGRQVRHAAPPSAHTSVNASSGSAAARPARPGTRRQRSRRRGRRRRPTSASVGAELQQLLAGDDQRVAGEPLLDLLGRAVRRRVGAAVPEVPVGQGLDDGRPVAAPGTVDRLRHRPLHGDHVVAVDEHARHPVGGGPVGGRVRHRGHRRDRRVLHVAVVLADEHHGQLPHRGEVERLVEGADVGGAVAEERDRDLRRTAELRRPGGAVGHRQVGADDRVGPEHPVVGAGQVHGAALGLADAGGLLHQLGQAALRRGTACDRVVVAAVGREHVVVRPQRGARADRHRLVPGGEVGGALDQPAHEQVVRGLLGAADHGHLLVASRAAWWWRPVIALPRRGHLARPVPPRC